jgi:hypothetical protein
MVRPIMQIETKRKLETFDEVVAELGGIGPVARLTNRTKSCICNWRRFPGRFPARLFYVINDALAMRGASADPDLFDFTPIPTTVAHVQTTAA